ncbi:hypothetical protein NDU88_007589 [Pleurodeles waltl]|uniref:Uncharacterized protein n=1 Tax=Pleurodeles waltl TaxID=8319 RepID=A0AAV7PLV5_PLEWA|nr:hypothetical protein NDU88_007589 [Pleurodeles waltl]
MQNRALVIEEAAVLADRGCPAAVSLALQKIRRWEAGRQVAEASLGDPDPVARVVEGCRSVSAPGRLGAGGHQPRASPPNWRIHPLESKGGRYHWGGTVHRKADTGTVGTKPSTVCPPSPLLDTPPRQSKPQVRWQTRTWVVTDTHPQWKPPHCWTRRHNPRYHLREGREGPTRLAEGPLTGSEDNKSCQVRAVRGNNCRRERVETDVVGAESSFSTKHSNYTGTPGPGERTDISLSDYAPPGKKTVPLKPLGAPTELSKNELEVMAHGPRHLALTRPSPGGEKVHLVQALGGTVLERSDFNRQCPTNPPKATRKRERD